MKDSKRGPSTSDMFQSRQFNHEYLWTTCALSDTPLGDDPIVSDYKGRLYNKSAILQMLLEKNQLKRENKNKRENEKEKEKEEKLKQKKQKQDPVPHINSLKDVVTIHFSKSDNNNGEENKIRHNSTNTNHNSTNNNNTNINIPLTWICPASQKPIFEESSGTKFIYLIPCGHVFAESAYHELHFDTCFVCDSKVDKKYGVVILNPVTSADVELLEKRYQTLHDDLGLTHSLVPIHNNKNNGTNSNNGKKKKKHSINNNKLDNDLHRKSNSSGRISKNSEKTRKILV